MDVSGLGSLILLVFDSWFSGIQYVDLAYTTALGFATVGANNGHNGTSGASFYHNSEVLADFAYRS